MIEGTPSARSCPRWRLCSLFSTTTMSLPAAISCWTTFIPTAPRPMTRTCPLSPVIRCRPSDSSSLRLTSTLVSSAKKTATNTAPASIKQTALAISHGAWPRKEKSP